MTYKEKAEFWDRVRSWAIPLVIVMFLVGCIVLPLLFSLVKFLAFCRIAFGY